MRGKFWKLESNRQGKKEKNHVQGDADRSQKQTGRSREGPLPSSSLSCPSVPPVDRAGKAKKWFAEWQSWHHTTEHNQVGVGLRYGNLT
jgi:hypothetical protein